MDTRRGSAGIITGGFSSNRWALGAFTLLVGAGLAVAAFLMIAASERQRRLRNFADIAEARMLVVEREVASGLEASRSVAALYAASREVEREEFGTFVKSILSRFPSIQALAWAPRVPAGERAAIEEAARQAGYPGFQITEQRASGRMISAGARPEYFPIYFVEPSAGNQRKLGFDLASDPVRWAVMTKARDSGDVASTHPVMLVQDAGQERGFLAFTPIYQNGQSTNTPEERREHLLGFGVAVLRFAALVQQSLEGLRMQGVTLYVDPEPDQPGDHLVYVQATDQWVPADAVTAETSRGVWEAQTVVVAGRTWAIRCRMTGQVGFATAPKQAWAILMLGLLLTGVMAAYFWVITGIDHRISQLITKRTAELSQANQALKQQFAERKRLEEEARGQSETLRHHNEVLAKQQQAMQELLREVQASKVALEAHNLELGRREGVMQSLLEDLNAAKGRIEEQAKALQASNTKLKEMAVLKDEFVAKVSHELRTPLTSVKEGLSLLLDRALGDITADQQDFLQTMDQDIDRLAELINNMLDISKIEAGRMRLSRARLEVPKLIASLLRSYQPIVGHRAVVAEVAEGLPAVFGDQHRLVQVFTNLLSNALKFTQDDGRITFRMAQRDGMVAIAVKDSGPGMSPEELPKLFQKFSQVGQPKAGVPRGTGLGLVVCKELTELHGGRIEVASEVGRGTTFTVLLPAYSNTFALTESFREQLELATPEEGQAASLIAIQAAALLDPHATPETNQHTLERLAGEVRQCLHRGDVVLAIPSWVVVIALTDGSGVKAVVRRLREKLPSSDCLQFGAALYPHDGMDAQALFECATSRANQGLTDPTQVKVMDAASSEQERRGA